MLTMADQQLQRRNFVARCTALVYLTNEFATHLAREPLLHLLEKAVCLEYYPHHEPFVGVRDTVSKELCERVEARE